MESPEGKRKHPQATGWIEEQLVSGFYPEKNGGRKQMAKTRKQLLCGQSTAVCVMVNYSV